MQFRGHLWMGLYQAFNFLTWHNHLALQIIRVLRSVRFRVYGLQLPVYGNYIEDLFGVYSNYFLCNFNM